jgi:integrase/recombinase XerC
MIQYLEQYIDRISNIERKSRNTIKAYRADVIQFIEYFQKSEKVDLKFEKHDMLDFLHDLRNQGISHRSIARKISVLKDFANFLIDSKIASEDNLFGLISLSNPKFDKVLPKIIDFETFCSVIEFIKTDSLFYKKIWQKKRDIALICLLYTSGMRISEALSIEKKDFLQTTEFIQIKGKGGRYRMSPILDIANIEIRDYLELCPIDRDFLFISNNGSKYSARIFQKNLENIRRTLNIGEFLSPHCLRHSCATELLKNGGQIRIIQDLLGHASLKTTQLYTQVAKNQIFTDYIKIMND